MNGVRANHKQMVLATSSPRARACRSLPNLVILLVILVVVWVGLLQITRLLQQLPLQQLSSLNQQFNDTRSVLDGLHLLDRSQTGFSLGLELSQNQSELILQRLTALELSLQKEEVLASLLEGKIKALEKESQILHRHLSLSVQFSPLKDVEAIEAKGDQTLHYFISSIRGRGMAQGPPELFYFPSDLSRGRLLCLKGNDVSYGTRNSYAFAFKEGLPVDSILLPGITLISDTFWDFHNPWHAMFNLVQFVHWRVEQKCGRADRLLLFHLGEYRTSMGKWIASVMEATGLPSTVEVLNYEERPVCFENAVLSRSGIGGIPGEMLAKIFKETRCQARRRCNISALRQASMDGQHINVTLVVRSGARGFVDEGAWQEVVKQQCGRVQGCSWSVMYVANLTFCEQVEVMSHTDILVSVHGAQLTNMIFMSPGARVMEMFPRGWLELAGHGQYIYRNLADWVGLQHEGYWRDPSTPDCPDPSDPEKCFTFYKDQPLGINATHIGEWLGTVLASFKQMAQPQATKDSNVKLELSADSNSCDCTS